MLNHNDSYKEELRHEEWLQRKRQHVDLLRREKESILNKSRNQWDTNSQETNQQRALNALQYKAEHLAKLMKANAEALEASNSEFKNMKRIIGGQLDAVKRAEMVSTDSLVSRLYNEHGGLFSIFVSDFENATSPQQRLVDEAKAEGSVLWNVYSELQEELAIILSKTQMVCNNLVTRSEQLQIKVKSHLEERQYLMEKSSSLVDKRRSLIKLFVGKD